MKSHLRFVKKVLAIIIFCMAFIFSDYNLNILDTQASAFFGLSKLKLYKGRVVSSLSGPIEGALVTAGAGWDTYPGLTKSDGSYATAYRFRGCPFYTYEAKVPVFIEMFYVNFNPKTNFIGAFTEVFYAHDFCCGGDYAYGMGILAGYGYAKNCWELEDEMDKEISKYRYLSVINVAILSGMAIMENKTREGIKYELSGQVPFADYEKTEYQYDQIGLSHDIADRGLVKQISREDLEKTDIYVYTLNDELIAERHGAKKSEIKGDEKNSIIHYNMYLRGSLTDSSEKITIGGESLSVSSEITELLEVGNSSDINDKDWNITRHLQPGENIKIVMINRPTGYIGTTIYNIKDQLKNGSVSIMPPPILMRQPKLLINAVRIPDLEATLSKQVPKPYIIGFEQGNCIKFLPP
ncbi:MAG: hypothetical protein HQK79_19780 [Desulfobacterales bacterium]|nr:hypothetical protein [Desulfobacterales bacterium]